MSPKRTVMYSLSTPASIYFRMLLRSKAAPAGYKVSKDVLRQFYEAYAGLAISEVSKSVPELLQYH